MALAVQAFYQHLRDNAGVAALVGTRIFPSIMPQDAALPVIVYTTRSAQREYAHTGPSQVADVRLELSCWSKSYLQAKQVADAVRAAVEGSQKATIGDTHTIEVMGMRLDNEFDSYDDETHLFRTIVDVLIPHRET